MTENVIVNVQNALIVADVTNQLDVNIPFPSQGEQSGSTFRWTIRGQTWFLSSDCSGPPIPLASFALQSYVYYISPFTVSATESPRVPALYRVALLADGTMARELVASGIERMQVQYGQLTTAPTTQYVDALPGFATATDTVWEQVNSVRIWLLARNATAEPGYVNSTTYPMGDRPFTAGDGFRRQLFTTVVQLRN